MAALNFADLGRPLSPEEPCGPDLEDDIEFMNVMARLEVVLPTTYFRRDDEGRQVAFDRASIDFAPAFADIGKLMTRTRNLRVLVLAAKLSLLNRDIAGFAGCLSAIAGLLAAHWDEIHPRAEDGDFIMREVALQSLDDLPTIVLPLQHAPILTSRRIGALAFRSQLVASGTIAAVEGEQHPEASTIQAALSEVELDDLVAMLGHLRAIKDAVAQIGAIWIEKVGVAQALSFPRLSVLVDQIIVFLEAALARRAPDKVVASPDGSEPAGAAALTGGSSETSSGCASILQVKDALAGCLEYFRRVEPSSPAVLLIGQAQQLIGKSLLEVIQIMFPEHVDKAIIEVGGNPKFRLPLERLAVADGAYISAEEGGSDSDGSAADAATGEGAVVTIASRAEAVSRMKAVASYYRQVEPSHPTPLLMDKACALAQHDFQSLLGDILPEVAIRPDGESWRS